MNASNLICGALQTTSGLFSDYREIVKLLKNRYTNIPCDRSVINNYIQKEYSNIKNNKVIDNNSAFEFLLLRDLNKACLNINSVPSIAEFEECMKRAYNIAINILRNFNLQFQDPSFYIVEEFPQPYNKMNWIAFAPDQADQEDYGIEPGVYFLKSELTPFYSELTLAHELVHVVIGTRNPYLLGRGLEEGIAELIGILYIGSKIYAPNIAKNVFKHSRLGYNLAQPFRLYLDYTRQAFLIYKNFGLKGLAYLMNEGREKIKEVEALLMSDKIDKVLIPAGDWDNDFERLCEEVLLGFIPSNVVSPLAVFISECVNIGMTIEEVSIVSGVKNKNVEEALEELQSRTFTVLIDKGKVSYSDLSFICKEGALRYEVNL